MKKIICMLLVAILSGCNPIVQPNIVSDNKVKFEDKKVIEVNPSTIPSIIQSQKPVEIQQTPRPESTKDTNINDSLKNINVSNSPIPSITPSVPSSSDPNTFPTDPKYGQGGVTDASQPTRYNTIDNLEPKPIPQVIGIISSGELNVTFKDSYKIRYNKQENKFYSETGYDTSNINKIIRDFEIKNIINLLYLYKTQEEADAQEIKYEKELGRDISNYASINILTVVNKDLGLLITLLRQDECVRASGIVPIPNLV